MIFSDYTYYKEKFCGKLIPQDDFLYFAARASEYIGWQTFGRLESGIPEEFDVKVRNCCCALAELLPCISAIPGCFTEELVRCLQIEITSIPHISIINSKSEITEAETLLKYKSDINGLLSEIYQVYKNISTYSGVSKDLSIELLWLTKEVANQTFNARIRLIVIIRSIDNNNVSALQSVESVKKLICDSLRLQKYEYTDYDNGALIQGQ